MTSTEDAFKTMIRLAVTDPICRPVFLQVLLSSTVYVICLSNMPEGESVLTAGSTIGFHARFLEDGRIETPFFSSLIDLQRYAQADVPYVALPATAFFEIVAGNAVVLNPASPYRYTFEPHDVDYLIREGRKRNSGNG